jgi:hypothetical protein
VVLPAGLLVDVAAVVTVVEAVAGVAETAGKYDYILGQNRNILN